MTCSYLAVYSSHILVYCIENTILFITVKRTIEKYKLYNMGLFKTNNKDTEGRIQSSLESPEERKGRLISLYITHFSMFLSGFGNAIIYIGMFPYIQAVSCFMYISYVDLRYV